LGKDNNGVCVWRLPVQGYIEFHNTFHHATPATLALV